MAPPNNRAQSPIPKRLREARAHSGLSQASLGLKAGLDPSVASTRVNQYERGVHNPAYPTMLRFAAVLGVPVPYFYCQDDALAAVLLQVGSLAEDDLAALHQWLAKRRS